MLVRSVLEGVAYNSRWLFDAYEKFLKQPVPKVRILGGGAQSDLWCQIYADVLARPVEQVADPRHAQLRGVALWARVCLGELTLDDVPALAPGRGDVHALERTPGVVRGRLRRVPQALRQAQGALPPAEREEGDVVNESYRVYGYRWVVLAVFMLVNLTIQMLWISYAPITSQAARYYGVSSSRSASWR